MAEENIHFIPESWGGSQYTKENPLDTDFWDECQWKTVRLTANVLPGSSEDDTTINKE